MKKIAVITGSSGMVGQSILNQLFDCDYEIRCLSRTPINDKRIKSYQGDINNKELISDIFNGADIVFHCAGEKADTNLMERVNVEGTKVIIDAVNRCNVSYFCYISSVGVYGYVFPNKLIDESTKCNPINLYEKTKFQAENLLNECLICSKLVILRPTNIIGSNNIKQLQIIFGTNFFSQILSIIKGSERSHIVDVVDVARAAIYFIDKDLPRRNIFIVSIDDDEDNINYKIYNLLRFNYPKITIKPPPFLPYILRKIIGGMPNYGDIYYSSSLLKKYGFKFSNNIRKILINYWR